MSSDLQPCGQEGCDAKAVPGTDRCFIHAPEYPEHLRPEEMEMLKQSLADIKAGRVHSHKELEAEFGDTT